MLVREIGTNKVETIAESLARDTQKTGKAREMMKRNIVKNILSLKIKDAEEDVKANEFKYHQCKRNLSDDINEEIFPDFANSTKRLQKKNGLMERRN